MKVMALLAWRELKATMASPLGFVISALLLAINGLLFNLWALGSEEKLSAEVLIQFFYVMSGTTMLASIFVAMRLLAEEQQTGTVVLLLTSPLRDWQIIFGKFLGAWAFLSILILVTLYMPMLIMINGKISWGHVFAGYLGLLLLAAASLSIGIFGSSLARNQIVAAFASGAILAAMVLLWMLGKEVQPPLNRILSYLSLHNMHFRSFMGGKIHLRDIIYYASVSAFFLVAAGRMLESRRWR